MTNDDLTQLEQLAAAATPGPWEAWPVSDYYNAILDPSGDHVAGMVSRADAAFIAAARDAIPALVAEVRRLQQDVTLLSDARDGYQRRGDTYRRRALALMRLAKIWRGHAATWLKMTRTGITICASHTADNARLRAALEAVEWVSDPYGGDTFCPWCSGDEPGNKPEQDLYDDEDSYTDALERWAKRGHKPDCKRQAALGGEQ